MSLPETWAFSQKILTISKAMGEGYATSCSHPQSYYTYGKIEGHSWSQGLFQFVFPPRGLQELSETMIRLG